MKFIFPLVILGLSVTNTSAQATDASQVQSFTLKNGMKVLVLEDNSIPNANSYLFWKVGSRNEVPGITGISHFFEHMMFNGAKKYGPKMFDRTMEAAGGANNAYTTEDITVYTNWFPASAMETIFDLEADRIGHLDINAKMVESERGVVASERTTGLENSNFQVLHEQLKGIAFQAHPYRWSVIGHESDIQAWTLADLKQYHKTYYAPNNGVLVVSGAVSVDEVKKLAAKYIEPIPAQPSPAKVRTVEPVQTGERRTYVQKASVTAPTILLGYHTPASSHADYYALDLLASILAQGESSRLFKGLVDKELALEVYAEQPQSFDPNLFYVYANAASGVSADKLEQALIAEVNRIASNGVSKEELDKVRNFKLMQFYREMETINGKANMLGTYELYFGSYQRLFDAPTYYNKVSSADIQRVAKTYLKKSNRSVAILDAKEDLDL